MSIVIGVYRRPIMLVSGRVVVIQRNDHFTLVPRRLILERQRGPEVMGIVKRCPAQQLSRVAPARLRV